MTKTCGECRYYEHPAGQCSKVIEYNNCHITDKACEYFEPKVITNGDKIIAGGNRALAEIFDDIYNGNKCKYCIHHAGSSICKLNPTPYSEYDEGYLDDDACLDGFEAWLNAPAESEGKQ